MNNIGQNELTWSFLAFSWYSSALLTALFVLTARTCEREASGYKNKVCRRSKIKNKNNSLQKIKRHPKNNNNHLVSRVCFLELVRRFIQTMSQIFQLVDQRLLRCAVALINL
jgi:hypothetical protein